MYHIFRMSCFAGNATPTPLGKWARAGIRFWQPHPIPIRASEPQPRRFQVERSGGDRDTGRRIAWERPQRERAGLVPVTDQAALECD